MENFSRFSLISGWSRRMISANKVGIFLVVYVHVTSGILVGNGSSLDSLQSIRLPSRQYLPVLKPVQKYPGRTVTSSVPESDLKVVSLEQYNRRKEYNSLSNDRTSCCLLNSPNRAVITTRLPTLKDIVDDYGRSMSAKTKENGTAWYYLQGATESANSKSSFDHRQPQAVLEAPVVLTTGGYGLYRTENIKNVKPIYEDLQNDEPASNYKHAQDVTSSIFPETSHSIVQSTGRLAGESSWNEPTKLFPSSQDATTAISTLNRFLNAVWNGTSYNSELHLPPNPVLALILSHYGRYVPGTRAPGIYSYMAANNIHNIKPFGKYKHERDEEPIYIY